MLARDNRNIAYKFVHKYLDSLIFFSIRASYLLALHKGIQHTTPANYDTRSNRE